MIDTHAHLGKVLYGKDPLTAGALIVFMDAHGIEKSVILPLVNPEEEHYSYTTEQALEDCRKHPDRFIPFVNVDPRRGTNDGNYDFHPLIEEYADQGCKGFGEILANLPTHDPRLKSIYRACGQLGLPVLPDLRFAASTVGVRDQIGLPYLEEALREFPETLFIGHGPAFWAEIAADVPGIQEGYPKGVVRKPGRVDYLMEHHPNLWADLSAMSGYNALARDRDYAKRFVEKHHRKLLFGTDYFVGNKEAYIIGLLGGMGLSASIKKRIFRKNAELLLKL
ncbi:MAG: amidohydrolase family protein [Candidatus Latescibacterota bacterium]